MRYIELVFGCNEALNLFQKMQIQLNPLCYFNIGDQFYRHSRVSGVLMGKQTLSNIEISTTFELPFDDKIVEYYYNEKVEQLATIGLEPIGIF